MQIATFPKLLAVTAFLALGACSETTSQAPSASQPAPQQALRTGSPQDEQACELAVTQQTNNPDVMTVSSEFSEANTVVILAVGQDKAQWRCLVNKGRVAEVTSLTNEGTL